MYVTHLVLLLYGTLRCYSTTTLVSCFCSLVHKLHSNTLVLNLLDSLDYFLLDKLKMLIVVHCSACVHIVIQFLIF